MDWLSDRQKEVIEDILTKRGQEAVAAIRENLASTGTNATLKTSNSVSSSVQQVGSRIVLTVVGARPFFPTVETGSKPSTKNPSPAMIESLTEWAQVRGKPKEAAWGIAKTILRDGSQLWQKGGRKDIYTNVREEIIERITRDIADYQKKEFTRGLQPSEAKFKSA